MIAVIVVAGLVPTHETLEAVAGDGERAATVAGHFLEYAALAFMLPLALRGWRPGRRVFLTAWAWCVGLGLAIELLQLALPYRSAQAGDALVNAAGAAFGVLLVSWAGRARERRSRWRHG
jgi:VanZ family protein